MSAVLTPISLRQSLNMPSQSLKVPILATLPGIIPLLRDVQPNCFQLRVMLDAVRSEFASEPRTFVAAEGKRPIHQPVCIDPDRSCFQSPGNSFPFPHASRPPPPRQPPTT